MSNYEERLRRLAFNDPGVLDELLGVTYDPPELDTKCLALVRLAALIAVDGPDPSFGEQADAALSAGATTNEIVAVLIGVSAVVGVPRVVSAAPKVALALGLDVDSFGH